ncbi:MAG: phosphodiester glycosidase family protein, partial [Actinomycetota bacterium]
TNDHQPVFAPDGDQILFTRVLPNGNKDLFTVPVLGGVATPLASNTPEADMSADWGTNVAARQVATLASVFERRSADPTLVRAPQGKKKKDKRPRRLKVAPGVRYTRFRRENSDVYLLKVNPDLAPTIDVSLSNDRLAGHERTSKMARRNKAVAAINGDFGMPSGRPSHTFAEDGDLKQLSFAVAWNFAITQDEKDTFFARPKETVTAEEDDVWRIERWNFGTEPAANDIAAYTPASGGLLAPPANACSAKLSPVAGPRWAPGMTGVESTYRVDAVGCGATPIAVNGGLVLAAQPGSDGAILLTSLTVGEEVDLGWSLGWNGVSETVGGTPLLVEESKIVAEDCPESICRRNPRTAIGVTSTGRILMLVIDGRRNDSVGVTMVELAQIMRSLHSTFALNLDGGGSSTMVVRGDVMNKPSDGNERKVSSAVLVLNGPDANESVGAAQGRAPALETGGASGTDARAALLDPGSTGGLLEAMAAGSFGPRQRLPSELRRALRVFESAR